MSHFTRLAVLALAAGIACIAGSASRADDNPNLWPAYRDERFQFHVSYPPEWMVIPPKGRHIRFSVNPPDGPGNCNIMARPANELEGMSQEALNQEIDNAPTDQAAWAAYAGLPTSKVELIENHRSEVQGVHALIGVLETSLENLQGQFMRKQTVAMLFTPGIIWAINCGASTPHIEEARSRYTALEPVFRKIIMSFGFGD